MNQIDQKSLVVILAAGRGSRMGPKSQQLNKVLFPIGPQAILSKILNSFPSNSRFLILTHYLENQIKDYMTSHHGTLDYELIHVDSIQPPKAGPGYSCLQARSKVDKGFYLVCGDAIWEKPLKFDPTKNCIGVSKVPEADYSRSCMIQSSARDLVENIFDKVKEGHPQDALAFNGIAFIKNYEVFFDGLAKTNKFIANEVQLSAGFATLLEKDVLHSQIIEDWSDVGTLESYQQYLTKLSNL